MEFLSDPGQCLVSRSQDHPASMDPALLGTDSRWRGGLLAPPGPRAPEPLERRAAGINPNPKPASDLDLICSVDTGHWTVLPLPASNTRRARCVGAPCRRASNWRNPPGFRLSLSRLLSRLLPTFHVASTSRRLNPSSPTHWRCFTISSPARQRRRPPLGGHHGCRRLPVDRPTGRCCNLPAGERPSEPAQWYTNRHTRESVSHAVRLPFNAVHTRFIKFRGRRHVDDGR